MMATIELRIVRPTNGQIFVQPPSGDVSVEFEGQGPSEIEGTKLFFRWYSSLNTAADARVSRYSLNVAALGSANALYTHPAMPMGSHIVTFATSDQVSEADIYRATVGGVTGGAKKTADRIVGHVIHVLKARILVPEPNASIARGSEFKAEAPWAWGDTDYQKYNRLRYRWRFEPRTASQPVFDFVGPNMRFDKGTASNPPQIAFQPSFPPGKVEGDYTLTLYVQCFEDMLVKGEATDTRSIALRLAP
jgi:hypothetical protein